MQTATLVTWTHPIPGREKQALEYAAEVQAFWSKKAAEGLCAEPELFFSEAGFGLWIVKGDRDQLLKIHDTEEDRLLIMKGELLLEGFKLETMYAGSDAVEYMKTYGAALAAIS